MAEPTNTLPGEIWKPVAGCEGSYEVSSLGRVKALRRMINRGLRGAREFPERILLPKKRGNYLKIEVYSASIGKSFSIHRLVCETFHGPRPTEDHEVAHWDGDPHNNAANNLRWATRRENAADRKRHGRNQVGVWNRHNKMAVGDIHAIRALSEMGWSSVAIAKIFQCSGTNIRNILNRTIWKHIE
jgi:hypothetical protein